VTDLGKLAFSLAAGAIMICLNCMDISPFCRRVTPVTLMPSTMLKPAAPKIEDPFNILLAKFRGPKSNALLLRPVVIVVADSVVIVVVGCANAVTLLIKAAGVTAERTDSRAIKTQVVPSIKLYIDCIDFKTR
jgi:hypothetical protein